MRKQVKFELIQHNQTLLSVRNIFASHLNQLQDKIKKNGGLWHKEFRKFLIDFAKVETLSKQIRELDRAILIQRPPQPLCEIIRKISQGRNLKRSIIIDLYGVKRYQVVKQAMKKLKTVKSESTDNKSIALLPKQNINLHDRLNPFHKKKETMSGGDRKAFNYILVFCTQLKTNNWLQLEMSKCLKIEKVKEQAEELKKCQSVAIIIVEYEKVTEKFLDEIKDVTYGGKMKIERIFFDDSETIMVEKDSSSHKWQLIKRIVKQVPSSFIFNNHIQGAYRFDMLLEVLPLLIPKYNFSWFKRRFNKDNYWELTNFLNQSKIVLDLSHTRKKQEKLGKSHYFNKILVTVSEASQEKIKTVSKKNVQIDQKKILQNLSLIKNKSQKQFFEQVNEILLKNKIKSVCEYIYHFAKIMKNKCVIIIETSEVYRRIENFICEEKPISYCHYEHPKEILQFNKNPTVMVCLVRTSFLMGVKFGSEMEEYNEHDQIGTQFGGQVEPEQYQCIGMASHLLFPDPEWTSLETKKRENVVKDLMKYCRKDLTRHYFINKGSYETKWIQNLQEEIIKIQLTLKLKDQLLEEEELQDLGNGKYQSLSEAFQEIQIAEVDQEYQLCKRKQGLVDIDEEFDRIEFEAMKQKEEREKKKKKKADFQESEIPEAAEDPDIVKVSKNKVMSVLDKIDPIEEEIESKSYYVDDDQECDIFLPDTEQEFDLETPSKPESTTHAPKIKDKQFLEDEQMEIIEIGNRKIRNMRGFKANSGVLKVILKPS